MKKSYHLGIKSAAAFLTLFLYLSVNVFAQTPQYYNYATGGGANSFPLNQPAGKMVQWLVLPGEFNTPTGARTGNITKFYFRIATGYPLGPFTYQQFKLILGQSTITSLPPSFYTGTMDTVIKKDTITLQAAADTWLALTLDHPFAYDSTKSLIIQMEQCGAPGASSYSLAHTTLTGNRRGWSVGGCPFTFYGNGTNVINCGIDVSTAPPIIWNVPELIYYRFENNNPSPLSTPNYASAPVGLNPAPIIGQTVGTGGEFDSCLVGNGGSGSTMYVNTGWNCNLGSGHWTLSMWVSNLTDLNPTYLFGDPGSGSFRCFYGGAAYPNNMLLRGPWTDILVACPMPGSYVFHFVWNGTNIIVYRNGVVLTTNARSFTLATGTGFKVGGYSTSSFSLNPGGKIDEFRIYNRDLTAGEVAGSWNVELPFSGVGINPNAHNLPSDYKLMQNYPNPFNPMTKITFAIPKTSNVKLTVYDVLGREVEVLVNEKVNAGTYDVQFNGANVASGVYFYRLEAGNFTDVKKMTLVK